MSGSYRVGKVTIDSAVAVKAVDAGSNRLTIKNTGTTILEMHNAVGDAYGTGYPLAPGSGFTFDDNGSMGGPVLISSAAAGGQISFMRF